MKIATITEFKIRLIWLIWRCEHVRINLKLNMFIKHKLSLQQTYLVVKFQDTPSNQTLSFRTTLRNGVLLCVYASFITKSCLSWTLTFAIMKCRLDFWVC